MTAPSKPRAGARSPDPAGIYLQGGGRVTNDLSGTISGVAEGVLMSRQAGTVNNAGTIISTAVDQAVWAGVRLTAGGSVANTGTSALISGARQGVYIYGGTGTVSNAGTIIGGVSYGVHLGLAGGSVTNSGTASRITGADMGVRLDGAGTVINDGTIVGAANGIYVLGGDGTLINAGTIIGTGGTAVRFGAGNDLLQLTPGATFTGIVDVGAGTNTLELAAGTAGSIGTISNSFTNFSDVTVDSGAVWTVSSTGTIAASQTLKVAGTLANGGSISSTVTLSGAGSLSNGGIVIGAGGGVVSLPGSTGGVLNSGTITGTNGMDGVYLESVGTVGNLGTAARIDGANRGVAIYGVGTVTNQGTIVASLNFGVLLERGGTVTNGASALISGPQFGIYTERGSSLIINAGTIQGGSGLQTSGIATVTNSGTIIGTTLYGAVLGGGSLSNTGSATITGVYGGVRLQSLGTIANDGSVTATRAGSSGIELDGGGLVTNTGSIVGAGQGVSLRGGSGTVVNTGTIRGGLGVLFSDQSDTFANTLINTGTIVGNGGTAVQFGAGNDLLAITPEAMFGGLVDGAGGSNTLELAAGAGTGTLTGIGTSFTNFATLAVDPGASWLLPGNETVATLTDAGTLANGGSITGAVTVTGTGVLNNLAGAAVTNLTGAGIVLASGGTVANAGLVSGLDGIDITGGSVLITNHGTILSTGPAGVGVLFTGGAGTIDNFGSIIGNGGTAVRFAGNSNTLIIESGGVLSGIADGSAGANILLLKGTGRLDAAQIVGFQFTEFTGTAPTVDGLTSIDNTVVGDGSAATALTNHGTLTGTLMVSAHASVTNAGTIAITTGSTNDGSVTNNALFTNASSFANAGSFTNTGLLTTSGTVLNSGLFTNTGTILGTVDGLTGSAGTIANAGTILGTTGTGVVLTGGSLTNAAGGFIRGGQYGVQVAGGSVTNAGTILDDVAAGASLGTGGMLTNGSGALVAGATGAIFTGTGASLVNRGTIAGTGGVAVQFDTGTGNSLTLDTGAVLTGRIDGGGGPGQITLAGTGTLANPIANFGAGSALAIAGAADWTASGSWTIASVTNNGTLQPGTPGSPLRLTGDFSQSPAGLFRVVLDEASGTGSELIVTGRATLAGQVQVVSADSFLAAKRYTIVTASGGVSGTFDSNVIAPALLAPTLGYDADDAFVTLVQRPVASPPPPPVSPPVSPPGSPPVSPPAAPPAIFETPNQHAAAVAVDQGLAANPAGFAGTLRGLDQLSVPQLRAALDRLSGEIHSALTTTALQAGAQFAQQFEEQGQLARRGASGTPSGQSAMAAAGRQQLARLDGGTDDPVANIDRPWGVWASGYGQSSQLDGDGNAHRLTDTVAGGAVGADYKLTPNLRVGAGLGYGGTSFSVDDGGGHAQVDHTQLALYAGYSAGPAYLDGTVGVAYGDGTTQRTVSLPGAPGSATGHFTDDQILGAVEAGYGLALGHATVTPFAGVGFDTVDQDGFAETGAGVLDLRVAKQSDTSVKSVLGSRLSLDVPVGSALVTTDLKLGWAHEFASVDRTALLAYAGAPTAGFGVAGAKPSRDSAVVGFGLTTALFADTSLYLHYDGDIDGPSTSHAISAGFRVSW